MGDIYAIASSRANVANINYWSDYDWCVNFNNRKKVRWIRYNDQYVFDYLGILDSGYI